MGSPTIFAGRRTKTLTTNGLVLRSKEVIDNDGQVNPIANGHFELVLLPWTTYSNAAQTTPVTGTGGTATITLARSTISPLYGDACGLLTKPASNRQGEGISYTATTPAGWQSKIITAVLDVEMSGGYDASVEIVDIFVYDVTNGALLSALSSSSQRVGTGKQQISCSFINSASATSLRIIAHIAGTGTTAWTMKIDQVKLVKNTVNGSVVSELYNGGVVTLPIGANTLVSRTSTDTAANRLKNKDLEDSTTAIVDASDTTKKILFDAGGTTATTTTVTAAQTSNRVVTLPDATDTLVGKATTDVLTNKDIDGGTADNTHRVTLPKASTVALAALTRKQGTIAHDTTLNVPTFDDGSNMIPLALASNSLTSASDAKNYTINGTVAANALTIALKTKAGSDATAGDPVSLGMRSSTLTAGTYNTRTVTAALSIVVPSTATLGTSNALDSYVYVYAIDNAGTIELAVSKKLFDPGELITTTAISGAATSATTAYSTSARTNVPCRVIGRLKVNETVAGTWAAVPTEITLNDFRLLPTSEIRVDTDNGYGSTGTSARKFTNVTSTVGSDITYTSSGVNGDSFTINADGLYAMSYTQALQTQGEFGISLNGAATTQVASLAAANRLCIAHTPNQSAANREATVSTVKRLLTGDVIRAHGDTSAGVGTAVSQFTITQLAKY